jgi:hypothetical protein
MQSRIEHMIDESAQKPDEAMPLTKLLRAKGSPEFSMNIGRDGMLAYTVHGDLMLEGPLEIDGSLVVKGDIGSKDGHHHDIRVSGNVSAHNISAKNLSADLVVCQSIWTESGKVRAKAVVTGFMNLKREELSLAQNAPAMPHDR